jgi:hypothetical protein
MNCVFVPDGTNMTLNGGTAQVQNIPQGYYCLPQRTGCDAHAGVATWTDQGWSCTCRWPSVMNGPECNTLVACKNNEVSSATQDLQQLLVNCTTDHPLCGLPWVPDASPPIDPTACYDKTKGFGYNIQCGTENATPNCVCQCDGSQANSNQSFTYAPNEPLTCALDSCNDTVYGRSLTGDAAYLVNSVPGVLHSFLVISPSAIQNQYLNLTAGSPLSTSATSGTKFEMTQSADGLSNGALQAFSLNNQGIAYNPVTYLTTNADGTTVSSGSLDKNQKWVLQKIAGFPQRTDNLDNVVLYNPVWNRPNGSQFTDPAYQQNRYLLFNTATSTFSLGSLTNLPENTSLVVMQKVESVTKDNKPYIPQPLTNCACSGANSISSLPACFDDNGNFVNWVSQMSVEDFKNCSGTYSRNLLATCDPYTIPNSVLTVQPDPHIKPICDEYQSDLKSLNTTETLVSSTNLLPFKQGYVPGLGVFSNPVTQTDELRSVCAPDPCTGKFGDLAFSVNNNSGNWDALAGNCVCKNSNTDDLSQNYYSFPVDYLNQQWNSDCQGASASSACVCNHVTNPVCGVCQNACQSGSPCLNSKDYPCTTASNLSCSTDPITGGPVCICMGDCIMVPNFQSKETNTCMKTIDTGVVCTGLESLPGVCTSPADTCKTFSKSYDHYTTIGNFGSCREYDPREYVTYCSSSTDKYCWDSQSPNNIYPPDVEAWCTEHDGYETCAIPT